MLLNKTEVKFLLPNPLKSVNIQCETGLIVKSTGTLFSKLESDRQTDIIHKAQPGRRHRAPQLNFPQVTEAATVEQNRPEKQRKVTFDGCVFLTLRGESERKTIERAVMTHRLDPDLRWKQAEGEKKE